MIDEIKQINKEEIFKKKEKNKISIIDKLFMILGYGKKR